MPLTKHYAFCIVRGMEDLSKSPNPTLVALSGIGISIPYAYQLISGVRSPSLKLALKIEREIGIPVSYWVDRKSTPASGVAA